MASGRQVGEQNVEAFAAWSASMTDDDYRSMEGRGVLSRKEIARQCGFAQSVLPQNPRVRTRLSKLEGELRSRSVLPPLAADSAQISEPAKHREPGGQKAKQDAERLRRLEQENAQLRAENAEVKRHLERYAVLREALAQSGRIPR